MASKTLTAASLVSMDAPVMESEKRYFAYRLGHMSRSNIQREVGRAEPRLHKLIGHCSLFDNARKFIIEQINNEDHDHDSEDEDGNANGDFWFDDAAAAAVDKEEVSFDYVEDVQTEKAARRVVVVTATQVVTEDYDDDDELDLEWDGDSDSSTEDGEDCSDDEWSDSTWEDDDNTNTHHIDSKPIDIYAHVPSQGRNSHCQHRDDDRLLWSQQPRVMSQGQANHLLIEAIG